MLKSPTAGFSLVELMVAMVSGLGIVLCVSSLYVAQLRIDKQLIEQIRFQQGVNMLIDVIERDVRRAGYLAAGPTGGYLPLFLRSEAPPPLEKRRRGHDRND